MSCISKNMNETSSKTKGIGLIIACFVIVSLLIFVFLFAYSKVKSVQKNNSASTPLVTQPPAVRPTAGVKSGFLAPTNFNLKNVVFSTPVKGMAIGIDSVTKEKFIKIDNNVKMKATEYTINGEKVYLYEPEMISPTPTP